MNQQLSLFSHENFSRLEILLEQKNLGTFKDSLKSPIHRWFKYPAGYSYRFVEFFLELNNFNEKSYILDPFVGTGTTNIVAKKMGINSVGIEAHPFVYWVANIKCFWEYNLKELKNKIQSLISQLENIRPYPGFHALEEFPELVHKCFSASNLWYLKCIRDTIENFPVTQEERDFFKLALTDTLRTASSAGSGWPYIAPSKYHEKNERPAFEVFSKTLHAMYNDICQVRLYPSKQVKTQILLQDARCDYPLVSESIDLVITSPPYLNNYDYADRTRLEMYFFALANSWGDITRQIRDKLIIAATTQVSRGQFADDPLCPQLKDIDITLYQDLSKKVNSLNAVRLKKGGKKIMILWSRVILMICFQFLFKYIVF